jgi:hypothetical protein
VNGGMRELSLWANEWVLSAWYHGLTQALSKTHTATPPPNHKEGRGIFDPTLLQAMSIDGPSHQLAPFLQCP